jgi:CHAT domain-containing protein
MKFTIAVTIMLTYSFAQAQFGDFIKKGLEKGKKMATEKLVDSGKSLRDQQDSTDFSYAITVIDNAGLADTRDAKDKAIKNVTLAINLYKGQEKSRNLLDGAEKLYGLKLYKLAEAVFLEAQLSYEQNGLTENINYSRVFADLGLLYTTMGRYQTAEKYTSEALAMREKVWGTNSKAYVSSLNNTAVLLQETAQYNAAEKYFEQALQTLKAIGAETSQEYATVLNNEGILFSKIGRYETGIEKLNASIVILNTLKKKDLKNQIGFQSNLALLYQQTRKFAEAEAIYLQLEKELDKELGSGSPFYAGVINNLALLYIQMGKLEKVEGYLKQAAGIYKSKFGATSPNYAKATSDLGNFYRSQAKHIEAEQALTEALNVRSTALGDNHPDYVKSQEDLGILFWKKGDLAKAYPFFQSALGKSLKFISEYFPPMSEAEKTKYWDILQPRFQRFYNYAVDANASNPDIWKDVYNYQIATKALLLNSTNKIKKSILESGDQSLIDEYKLWIDQKEELSRFYSLSKEELQQQKIDISDLEKRANATERSLSQKSADFSEAFSNETTDFTQVASLLTDSEALVEVIQIKNFANDFTTDTKYIALVLTKGALTPKNILLENGTQLDTRFAKYYKNSISQKSSDAYSYEQYWARLEPQLVGKKTIYISPDGVYNQINLNTLKKQGGDYVLNLFELIVIGNSKDLIAVKKRKAATQKKDAFLLGFPDYAGAALPLPGTKVEVEGINKILIAAGYKTTLREQKLATETMLKAINGTSILHIATHGYFLADADLQGGDALGANAESAKNNPLLRSGLILAGAQTKSTSADLASSDNGILTAYEAMNLNLEGTDLIVLSACETGLGDVKAGEGVYGLQRAFLVAGADAMIMSLWKVDDAATQQLMTNFYTNWTKTGNKVTAFKLAQQQLMVKYKEPYYWGAFVMVGI